MPYVGELEVKLVERIEDTDYVTVTFTDESNHPQTKIHVKLLNEITTEEKGAGSVGDCVNHYFAKSFISQMALMGMKMYAATSVAMAMQTLAHNLREAAISSRFDCSGGDDMLLSDLIPEDGTEEYHPGTEEETVAPAAEPVPEPAA